MIRATDLKAYKDAVFAYNQAHSQSGYAAAFWHVKPLGFWFEQTFYSRGHVASAKAGGRRTSRYCGD